MKLFANVLTPVLLCMTLLSTPNTATAAENAAVTAARQAMEDFLVDWNAADLNAIQEHLSFPHITHNPGTLIIAQNRGEFVQDFDLLRQQGWRRSTFDNFQALQVSDNKVNFLVNFRRYDEDDNVMADSQVFYVVTRQDGHWGMQYRSGGPRAEDFTEAELDRIRLEATTAVYKFFEAFNAADPDALFVTNHVPQAMLNNDTFMLASDPQSPLLRPNFAQLRQTENWSHSVPENIQVIHAMPGKVIFELTFERFDTSGQKYRTVPALWVLTQIDGKWGVQFRSLMPPE